MKFPCAHMANPFPTETAVEMISFDDLECPIVRAGWDYWCKLRGARAFPARADIRPRDIAPFLTNMVLVKVLDGGADFLLKIVGDEVSLAYRAVLINRRMSEIAADLPNTVQRWGAVYAEVVRTGLPAAVRVTAGLEVPEITFSHAETVCLPFGASDDQVDHVVTFGQRFRRGGFTATRDATT
jgi:hypothetical protein